MGFTIKKQFKFEAAHQLEGLPEDHQCGRLHGHSYKVIIELYADTLDSVGFVLDYGKLKKIVQPFIDRMDHQCLNDVFELNPTAEILASRIFVEFEEWLPQMRAVTVKETEGTEATYRNKEYAIQS